MNQALKLIAGAAVVVLSSAAFAQSATQTFAVTATVAAKCESNTTGSPTVAFGSYTAFAGAALPSTSPANVSFRCTRNLALTSATLSGGTGTVAGLAYTLTLGSPVDTVEGTGTAAYRQYAYSITGSIAAGQAGEVGAATSDTVTLTLAY